MSETTGSSSRPALPLGEVGSPEFIAARRAAMANSLGPDDDGIAMLPVGHQYGLRFNDPGELDPAGRPKPVIDVMLPWSRVHAEILRSQVVVDEETGHHLPTLEAALVGKYAALVGKYAALVGKNAALVSPNRNLGRKGYDAADFRIIVQCNQDDIDRKTLRRLATLVWDGGGKEIVEFVDLAIRDEPFSL